MTTYPDVQLFIDGDWCDAADGRTLEIIDPATGQEIGRLAHAGKADLDRALAAVERGFRVWSETPAFTRYKLMRKAADLLRQRAGDIALVDDEGTGQAARPGQGRSAGRRGYDRLVRGRRPPHLRPGDPGARTRRRGR